MKAYCLSSKLSVADSASFVGDKARILNTSLLTETILVTIASILVIKLIDEGSIISAAWFAVPAIWVAAAIIPTAIKGRKFAQIGFSIKQLKHTLLTLCWVSVVVFPAMFFGLWLLNSYGLEIPLRPGLPQNQSWLTWLFYQFMYVAVAEEVFFRGYVQANIQQMMNTARWRNRRLKQWITISISAACFAAAHIIVQGQIISVLTFLPALIYGWLFIRTRGLLAPILFHGLANTCYCLMTAVFA
jgi:membrane protease YdiL (CAAX protease family)